jgi:hypothetical protein
MSHHNTAVFIFGLIVVLVVCFDIFHTIIMPRLALRHLRFARFLVAGLLWPMYRFLVRKMPVSWRPGWLELFAPTAFIILLGTWLLSLICGFAFIMFSLGHYVRPPVTKFSDALYFAGTSVLTLGFGDLVAAEWPARIMVLLAAVLGLIFMALVVSLLFSMLSYLQQRESVVNTLMSRAGLPPSGVVLLMRYRELNIVSSLSGSFISWETWVASILESHRAFPLLVYFRSNSHENSWLAAVGATLDAASLLLTSIENDWVGEADLYYWMGVQTLKAMNENDDIQPVEEQHLERAQFDEALRLLQNAGYKTKSPDKVWPYFSARRSGYMRHLIPLARRFEAPLNVWMPEFKVYTLPKESSEPVSV